MREALFIALGQWPGFGSIQNYWLDPCLVDGKLGLPAQQIGTNMTWRIHLLQTSIASHDPLLTPMKLTKSNFYSDQT